jgi:small GTP-binding protein
MGVLFINFILQIWDLGGQERFEFMKEQYLKGAGVVGLCFDLTTPTSFQKLKEYLEEIRTMIGDVPVLLIGNKQDLEQSIGETISKDEIDQWMLSNHVSDFIKTSAKNGDNVDEAFRKLASLALKSLKDKPKPGQYKPESTILAKVVFIGAGGVGKTSLIHRYVGGVFAQDYKLTIGVDFLTKQIDIDESTIGEDITQKMEVFKAYDEARQKEKEKIDDKEIEAEELETDEIEQELQLLEKDIAKIPEGKTLQEEKFVEAKEEAEFSKFEPSTTFFSGPPTQPGGAPVPKPVSITKEPIKPPYPLKKVEVVDKFASEDAETALPKNMSKRQAFRKEEKSKSRAAIDQDIKGDIVLSPAQTGQESMTEAKLLHRKTTVFYRKQMNPFTLNKLSVVLSTVQIYEQLKNKIVDAERAASGKTLEIKEISPYIQVEPYFPGCVCVPAMIPLDARLESTTADFQITPLATGRIPEASVRLYYEGKLIDVVKTPTKVVKQTAAKISATVTAAMPVFGPLFDSKIGSFLQNLLSTDIWNLIGGIEGFFLVLSGISALFGSVSYFMKKPKEAQPVEANFPELETFLKNKA